MKKIISALCMIAVLCLTPCLTAMAQTETDEAGHNTSIANVTYAPQNYYAGTVEKRFHLNQGGYPQLLHPAHNPTDNKDFSRWEYNAAFQNSLNLIDLDSEPGDTSGVIVTPLLRKEPEKAPIVILSNTPAHGYFLGSIVVKGEKNDLEYSGVLKGIHVARWLLGATHVEIFVRVKKEAAQAGISLGTGGAYGQVLGPNSSPDDKLVVLNAGAIMGYSKHWMDDFCQIKIKAYSLSVDDKAKDENPPSAENIILAAAKIADPEIVRKIGPIFFDWNKSDIIQGQPIKNHYAERANIVANVITDMHTKNLLPDFILFSGQCDITGDEKYNLDLGKRRAQNVMLWIAELCEQKGMPRQTINEKFIFVSAGNINRHNPFLFTEDNNLNRRVDIGLAKMIAFVNPGDLIYKKKGE